MQKNKDLYFRDEISYNPRLSSIKAGGAKSFCPFECECSRMHSVRMIEEATVQLVDATQSPGGGGRTVICLLAD